MSEAVLAAVEALRSWLLLARLEVALVLPVVDGVPGPPCVVAVGDAGSVRLVPGQVLRAVLRTPAEGFVLVHTHTTDVPPGPADVAVTRRLMAASVTVGVPMLGHLVLAPRRTHDCFEVAAALDDAA